MYTPKQFTLNDPEHQYRVIRENLFATLVTQGTDGLHATHLPLLLEERAAGPVLCGHMALGNPQLDHRVHPVLVIFTGPHAYISPRWYETEGLVPTWNYVAVHVHGTLRVLEDADASAAHLDALIARLEPQGLPALPAERKNALMSGIRAFEINVGRIEGKAKLGQNRKRQDIGGAVAGLESEGTEAEQAMAALMKALTGEPNV